MVLGSYIALSIWGGESVKSWLIKFLFKFNLGIDDQYKKIFTTYSIDRPDYHYLMHQYFGQDSKPFFVGIKNSKSELLSNPLSDLYYALKSVVFICNIQIGLFDRIKFMPLLSICFKIIDSLESKKINCEKYIAFNSSYKVESFLCFYFRNRGIETISLQHGMYYKYHNEVPLDIINYENVCADLLLTWGRYSYEQTSEFLPKSSRSIIFGYPFEKQRKQDLLESDDIYVVLPRVIYWDAAKDLLRILSSINPTVNYIVRPHPSIRLFLQEWIDNCLDKRFFLDDTDLLVNVFKEKSFKAVVGFNTTAIFQALLYDQNVLIYEDCASELKNPGFKLFRPDDEYEQIESLFVNDEQMTSRLKDYCFHRIESWELLSA